MSKYWASCLQTYQSNSDFLSTCLLILNEILAQFRTIGVQRYVHDLVGEMNIHLDNTASSLATFIEIGIYCIFYARGHAIKFSVSRSSSHLFRTEKCHRDLKLIKSFYCCGLVVFCHCDDPAGAHIKLFLINNVNLALSVFIYHCWKPSGGCVIPKLGSVYLFLTMHV